MVDATTTDAGIIARLERLATGTADAIEDEHLEFKPFHDPKSDLHVAVEYASCFANADGGVIVFGVEDKLIGRAVAIKGIKKEFDLDYWRRAIFDTLRPNLKVQVDYLDVPEGKLIVVRVPKGTEPPYGTASGLFKRRIGKNCMPLDPASFARSRVQSGAVDWSAEPADDCSVSDIDPSEITRARALLQRVRPNSDLATLPNEQFLQALGALRQGRVTNTGMLLFGQQQKLADVFPQAQLHYVLQSSETAVVRNDNYRLPALRLLERIEELFTGPSNPEQELRVGLFVIRVPAFPLEVVREAVLNAITHRDYSDPADVLVRQAPRELVVVSPGAFIGGITPRNILRHETVSRNRALAEAFQKLGYVERAGVGRRRIYKTVLEYGKRPPVYEDDGHRVTLRVYDGAFDEKMAALIAEWKSEGAEIELDGLLVLSYLRDHDDIDSTQAAEFLQTSRDDARAALDVMARPKTGFLERLGQNRAATYRLAKGVAVALIGEAAYTKSKGINPIRYAEMVRAYLADHREITPKQVRELLQLGDSRSAQVEVSRLLGKWTGAAGFLEFEGRTHRRRYRLRVVSNVVSQAEEAALVPPKGLK